MTLRQHLAATAGVAGMHAARTALTLALLPYEATVNLDAIARTIWRILVTHRGLLEWSPSAGDESNRHRVDDAAAPSEFAASVKSMWIAPIIALGTAILLTISASSALAVAAPILFLWFVSPVIAWWISRPLARREAQLTMEQTLFLRKLARRTWAFFETFVGPDDHWLPPDNYQEHPVASVAHRTSPTNMGLALLANLTAYDFGYIPAGQLILRTANATGTMKTMERHEGHFYNWYDTQSLKPLPPLYVSAVDSGNLAGHLMTLRRGLLALADDRILDVRWFEGLSDTLRTSHRRGRRDRTGIARSPAEGSGNRLRLRGPRPSRRRGSGSTGSTRALPKSAHRSPTFPAPIPPAHLRAASETTFWADALAVNAGS